MDALRFWLMRELAELIVVVAIIGLAVLFIWGATLCSRLDAWWRRRKEERA